MNKFTRKQLTAIQFEEFPNSVIISWNDFIKLHLKNPIHYETIEHYLNVHPNSVCYYLKTSDHTGHYNGIRFGEEGDYCSFTHINPEDLNDGRNS